jgi:hypothetical protein
MDTHEFSKVLNIHAPTKYMAISPQKIGYLGYLAKAQDSAVSFLNHAAPPSFRFVHRVHLFM